MGPIFIKEQYPEGTEFMEINGLSELLAKAGKWWLVIFKDKIRCFIIVFKTVYNDSRSYEYLSKSFPKI